MEVKTHWFVERLPKMISERKDDIDAISRLLGELQDMAHEEDAYTCLYEIVEAINEVDSGIAEVIGLYIESLLELDSCEMWETMSDEDQALFDANDQKTEGVYNE